MDACLIKFQKHGRNGLFWNLQILICVIRSLSVETGKLCTMEFQKSMSCTTCPCWTCRLVIKWFCIVGVAWGNFSLRSKFLVSVFRWCWNVHGILQIHLYINSPGGVVTAGLAIYDTMQVWCPFTSILLHCKSSYTVPQMVQEISVFILQKNSSWPRVDTLIWLRWECFFCGQTKL